MTAKNPGRAPLFGRLRRAWRSFRVTEAAGLTLEEGPGWRPLTGDGRRDLGPLSQRRMQELAVHQWERNRLANRLIELPLSYLLGEGVRLVCDDPQGQAWLDAFWHDPVNRLDRRLKELVRSYKLFGELVLPVTAHPVSGEVRLGYVDPGAVHDVVTDPGGSGLVAGVEVHGPDGEALVFRTLLPGADPERAELLFSEEARAMRAHMKAGDCFLFRRNALPDGRRGRSDLLSAIDFCDLYEQMIYGEAERATVLRQVVYDVTLKGATEAEVQARARSIETPRPLSVRVHNEAEEWQVLTPDLRAGDASETARLIRGHVLGGATLPEHWYGQGGDVNRATAGEMGEPTFKVLSDEQRELGALLSDVGGHVLSCRLRALGHPDKVGRPEYRVRVEFPELTARDTTAYAGALANLVGALLPALERGLLSEAAASALIAQTARQLGVKLDPVQELATARREAAGRAAGAAGAGSQGGEAGPEGRRPFAEGYPEFDPDQPRAEDGRWTDGGGGGGGGSKASGAVGRTPSPVPEDPRREGMRFLRDPEEDRLGAAGAEEPSGERSRSGGLRVNVYPVKTGPGQGGGPDPATAARGMKAEDWQAHEAALGRLKGVPENAQEAMLLTTGWEGGNIVGANGSRGGILRDTLNDLTKAGLIPGIPAGTVGVEPRSLTQDQLAAAQIAYLNGKPNAQGTGFEGGAFGKRGVAALKEVKDQKVVNAVVDTVYWQGTTKGAEIVQRALVDVGALPADTEIDGVLGSGSMKALAGLTPERSREFLEKLKTRRSDWLSEHVNKMAEEGKIT
ncbi:MAG TPA: hypothetical protein VED40_10410 [Azospirillaceae bacterium]|nr:hypothetical protein [Azospirillaceae bacterium]